MTREEVYKLYFKIILEYGIKEHSQLIIANSLVKESDLSIEDKRTIITNMIHGGGVSFIMNSTHDLDFAKILTADHIFNILVLESKHKNLGDWFSASFFHNALELLNNKVDFDNNCLKASFIEEIEQRIEERKREQEYWDNIRNREEGSDYRQLEQALSVMLADFDEEGEEF
jgi:hypothetical protein